MSDITSDVQYYLQNHPLIQALVVDPYIGKDDGWVNGWIFDSEMQVRMENTQRCAISVTYAGGFNPLLEDNTARFPLLAVDIWADPERAEDETPVPLNAKTKAFHIFDEGVFPALHLNKHGEYYFNETRVTSCEILGEPLMLTPPDGNGLKILRANVAISYF